MGESLIWQPAIYLANKFSLSLNVRNPYGVNGLSVSSIRADTNVFVRRIREDMRALAYRRVV